MFFHGSGEIEAKLLQYGVQLNGHTCHTAGLDSDDFDSYDAYFLFSLRTDVLSLLQVIPNERPCLIVPQIEIHSKEAWNHIQFKEFMPRKLTILERCPGEADPLRRSLPAVRAIYAPGWFLRPFIHTHDSSPDLKEKHNDYHLCMVGAGRECGLSAFAAQCQTMGMGLQITSDSPERHSQMFKNFQDTSVSKRVSYGSSEWFRILRNCSGFYEPNSYLTCSMLEAMWLGKNIYSPHFSLLNSMLGKQVVRSPDLQQQKHEDAPLEAVRGCIDCFHANFVAASIIQAIK
jgi:hypothetical protein